jgi:acyl-CoA synthetase (NDP forming)
MTGLRELLGPRTIAVIGASSDPSALSGRPLRILRDSGYTGALYPVNPRHEQIDGIQVYPSIGAVPAQVDVALILVPKAFVLDVLHQCAAAKVGLAVVFSSGFAEEGGPGTDRERQIAELAASTGLRIIGPNAEGFLNTAERVPATFSPAVEANLDQDAPNRDHVTVISQSGGLGFALFDRGAAVGLGFDYVVSTGNEADVDAVDVIDDLVRDGRSRVLLLVAEGFTSLPRFLAAADQARRAGTAIVVAKLGASSPGARAALAHTAHQVGSDADYRAAFLSHGVLRAQDEDELVDLGMLLARARPSAGGRVGIMTTSGGAGVWLADACSALGLSVPELTGPLQEALRPLMPTYGSPRNPVDLTAEAIHGGGLVEAMELLLRSGEVDSIAVISSLANPTGLVRHRDRLVDVLATARIPVLMYSYTRPADANVALLADLGLPWFPTPTRTARALAVLRDRGADQVEVPSARQPAEERDDGVTPVIRDGDPSPSAAQPEEPGSHN